MAALLSQFIGHLCQLVSEGHADNIVASVPLEPTHPFYSPLRVALSSVPSSFLDPTNIESQIRGLSEDSKSIFVSFVASVLANVKGAEASSSDAAAAAYGDYERLVRVYTDANRLYGFSTPTSSGYLYPCLNPFIVNIAKLLCKLSTQAARLSTLPGRDPRSSRSIRDQTRQIIERSTIISRSDQTETEWSELAAKDHIVGDNVWILSNILFRIYAERKLHTQATELVKHLESMSPREEKRIASRPRPVRPTDLCQSYYWRGRLGVILLNMNGAKYWLDKSWRLLPSTARQQRRAILIRLLPVNLLLGFMPAPALLKTFELELFIPLCHAYVTGNIVQWRAYLFSEREWFRKRGIWLLLFERGEILVWRNLLRNTLKMYYQTHPTAPKGRCPTHVFVSAARKVFQGSDQVEANGFNLHDMICVIASLIDQGYILGHLSYSQQTLVMRPSEDGMGGFPKVAGVMPRAVVASDRRSND
ncbi:hypothetical protein P7C73_g3867, partial [Tremellales sp. Uapishka_1]